MNSTQVKAIKAISQAISKQFKAIYKKNVILKSILKEAPHRRLK